MAFGSRFHSRVALASIAIFFLPPLAQATRWSTLMVAHAVDNDLATPEGRAKAIAFCKRLRLDRVYLESFRDGEEVNLDVLRTARDEFRKAGFEVSGMVTTTRFGKLSPTGWAGGACFTNRAGREHLSRIFANTAKLFDTIMIDDFLFTECRCSECARAKGDLSWEQYRRKLMLDVSRQDILASARAANPRVKVILKFPQWYDNFQDRGYSPVAQAEIYDGIWTGTELRDPSSQKWGHKQQYEGFFLFRWLTDIAGPRNGGGWFDPYGTDPVTYLDQAYVTILAGAPEVMLFNYESLASEEYRGQTEMLAAHRAELDALSKVVDDSRGIPAYKPPASNPDGDDYIFDKIGMLAMPLAPVAKFPANAKAALFTVHALKDAQFVRKLSAFLKAGGTAFVSENLARRLNGDPEFGPATAFRLESGKLFQSERFGAGTVDIFSSRLPDATFVDDNDRVEQIREPLRSALAQLRAEIARFTVTSVDAPVRVAIFPMKSHVAVANFTELPVSCTLRNAGRNSWKAAFATSGASVMDDGRLVLPPHGILVVE